MTESKLRIQSTIEPTEQLSQDEWFNKLGVSSGYIEPTRFYGGNFNHTDGKGKQMEVSWQNVLLSILNIKD